VPIGVGRWLTEPMVLARLIQTAQPKPGDKIMVAGSGVGYAGAVLARVSGTVVMLESDGALMARARTVSAGLGLQNAVLVEGPLAQGYAKLAPYDVILIDGGVEQVPVALTDQLAAGGRLVTVVLERGIGRATIMQKTGNTISSRVAFDAAAALLPGFDVPARFVF
jgi:protein-L-isoaspartate(D-aspartate) O-methyltransferase